MQMAPTYLFLQQGTDKSLTKDEISLQLERKYFEYYASLRLPVLIVYISVPEEKTWATWASNFVLKESNASRSINFTGTDILTAQKVERLLEILPKSNSNISLEYEGFDGSIETKILLDKWAKHYFPVSRQH